MGCIVHLIVNDDEQEQLDDRLDDRCSFQSWKRFLSELSVGEALPLRCSRNFASLSSHFLVDCLFYDSDRRGRRLPMYPGLCQAVTVATANWRLLVTNSGRVTGEVGRLGFPAHEFVRLSARDLLKRRWMFVLR